MKNRLAAVLTILLVVSVTLGNVPFRDMLVCIHAADGERAIHLHYGQLRGQPCDETVTGLSRLTTDEDRWHFSLDLETVSKPQTSIKRFLKVVSAGCLQRGRLPVHSAVDGRSAYPFFDPSFVSLDTAFTHTTILII